MPSYIVYITNESMAMVPLNLIRFLYLININQRIRRECQQCKLIPSGGLGKFETTSFQNQLLQQDASFNLTFSITGGHGLEPFAFGVVSFLKIGIKREERCGVILMGLSDYSSPCALLEGAENLHCFSTHLSIIHWINHC